MKQVVEAETCEPHPKLLAAIMAAARAGACAEAARGGHGVVYAAVAAAHRRLVRDHLERVVGTEP